jgi:hypothetical protein
VVTLGTDADGWTMRKAERALEQILAEIQVGVWRPPSMSAGGEDPTFHEFASRWWFARKSELRLTTQADYEWRLRKAPAALLRRLPGLGDHDRACRGVPQ